MKFSYKNWKKVSAEKEYTVFQNPRGDELKVAHTRLSPKVRGELAALPVHMADGGKVKPVHMYDGGDPAEKAKEQREEEEKKLEEDTEIKDLELKDPEPISSVSEEVQLPEIDMTSQPPAAPMSQAGMMAAGYGVDVNAPPAPQLPMPVPSDPMGAAYATAHNNSIVAQAAPMQPSGIDLAGIQVPPAALPPEGIAPQPVAAAPGIAPQPVAAAPAQPLNDMSAQGLLSSALTQGEAGLLQEQQTLSKLANTEQKVLAASVLDQQAIAKDFESKNKEYRDEIDNFIADYKTGQVDPQRVWNNKSTESKIATAIGILASGIGAGMSGQENMAMKVMNQEIERDIEAQKANLSHKGNILSALSQQMGSLRAGTEMLRNIKLGIASDKMKAAAATAKDPLAQAALLKGSSDLRFKMAESTTKLAASQAKGLLTPAQKAVDEAFAKDYNEWQTVNKATVEKNTNLLNTTLRKLELRKRDFFGTSGRIAGRTPDILSSEDSLQIRDDVRNAVMSTMKATLGPAFTEREGERVIAASYNETLSPEKNIEKIKTTMLAMKTNVDNMNSRSEYYEQNGSLRGWISPKSGERNKALIAEAHRRLKANPNDQVAKTALQRLGVK